MLGAPTTRGRYSEAMVDVESCLETCCRRCCIHWRSVSVVTKMLRWRERTARLGFLAYDGSVQCKENVHLYMRPCS